MFHVYLENAVKGKTFVGSETIIKTAKELANGAYDTYKELKAIGQISGVWCVRIYDDNDELVTQYGPI